MSHLKLIQGDAVHDWYYDVEAHLEHLRNKYPPLTEADLERAAGIVGAISAIPTLQGGFVGFNSGLAGGHWSRDVTIEELILVPIPTALDADAARQAILEALQEAREEIHEIIARDKECGHAVDVRTLEVERRGVCFENEAVA